MRERAAAAFQPSCRLSRLSSVNAAGEDDRREVSELRWTSDRSCAKRVRVCCLRQGSSIAVDA